MTSETSSALAFKNVKGGDFRAPGDGITYRVRKVGDTWHVLTQLAGQTQWVNGTTVGSKEEAQEVCQNLHSGAGSVLAEGVSPAALREPPVEDLPAGLDASKIVAGSFGKEEAPAVDDEPADGEEPVRKDLRAITRRRNQAAQRLDELDAELRDRVVAAFSSGMTVRPIMDDTGLSKSRVYQIRDGRR